MEQEDATRLFDTLGVLLLLNPPSGMEFGIDNLSWEVGNKFRGIKMIPLGTHLVTYSLASENHMFKSSKFLHFAPKQRIHIYRFYGEVDQFLEVKGAEGQGYRQGVAHYHFDAHLGPYPPQNLPFWKQNTNYITQAVLDKLDPIPPKAPLVTETQTLPIEEEDEDDIPPEEEPGIEEEEEPIGERDETGRQRDQQVSGNARQGIGGEVYYSAIPRALSSTPQQTTLTSLDKTPILAKVLQKQWNNQAKHLLGELQYSFVHFVLGEQQQSLQQWKLLLNMLVGSESAYLNTQPYPKLGQLVMDFIPVLYDQLKQLPEDFFRDELSKGNFLCQMMRRLYHYSQGEEYAARIGKRIVKLMRLLQSRFDYYVDQQQQQQDGPVVVEEGQSYF